MACGSGFLCCRGGSWAWGSIITGAGVGVLRASIITDKLPLFYPVPCCPLFRYSVFVVLLCGIQYPWFAVRGSGFGLAWYGRPGAGGWQGRAGQGRAGQGEKIKPRGGATNNRMDDKATPGMSEPNCAALGHPTPEIFVA